MNKRLLVVMAVCAALSAPAMANTYTYSLTSDHCSGGCGTAPFGTITVMDTGTNQVTLTIALTPSTDKLIHTGFAGTLGFNLNPAANLSVVSTSLPGWYLNSPSDGSGAFQYNGFGNFMYSVDCQGTGGCGNGGGGGQLGPEVLVLSGTGLTALSFNQLSSIPPGSEKAFFVVDIFSSSTGNTGPVGAVSSPVPDGGVTLMLLGGVLVGLATLRRRFTV